MNPLRRFWFAALACLGLLWAAHAHAQADNLRIGSKRFTESYILAEVLAQTAAPHLPSRPVVRQGLGNTAIVYEALSSGGIDLYAEYTGYADTNPYNGWILGASVGTVKIPNLGLPEVIRYVPLIASGVLIVSFSIEHIIALLRGEEVVPSWN